MRTLASTGSKSIPISELRQGWRIPLRFWIDHIRPMRSAASRNYEFTSSNGELDLHSPNGPFCRDHAQFRGMRSSLAGPSVLGHSGQFLLRMIRCSNQIASRNASSESGALNLGTVPLTDTNLASARSLVLRSA
jgi:hypothetical protein